MAFGRTSFGSPASGGRSMGAGGQRTLSDINVTPLVDVMLVLLVIFIITAPLMASSLRLDLPRSGAGAPISPTASVRIEVDAQGSLHLDGQAVDDAQLAQQLQQAAAAHRETEVQLRADQRVPYGRIVQVMGMAHQAGLGRIGFVTEPAPVSGAQPAASPAPVPQAPKSAPAESTGAQGSGRGQPSR